MIYNWGNQGYGGGHSAAAWNQDLIGNYLIAGPDSGVDHFFTFANANDLVHSEGNYVDLDKDGTLNGRPWTRDDLTRPDPKTKDAATPATDPFNAPPTPVRATSAEQAVKDAIRGAGNSLHRDAVDLRQIEHLQSYGKLGKTPANESDVGGPPPPPATQPAPIDTDRDGLPDAWETAHKLNPNDPADGKAVTESGYTNLETYLNALVP